MRVSKLEKRIGMDAEIRVLPGNKGELIVEAYFGEKDSLNAFSYRLTAGEDSFSTEDVCVLLGDYVRGLANKSPDILDWDSASSDTLRISEFCKSSWDWENRKKYYDQNPVVITDRLKSIGKKNTASIEYFENERKKAVAANIAHTNAECNMDKTELTNKLSKALRLDIDTMFCAYPDKSAVLLSIKRTLDWGYEYYVQNHKKLFFENGATTDEAFESVMSNVGDGKYIQIEGNRTIFGSSVYYHKKD